MLRFFGFVPLAFAAGFAWGLLYFVRHRELPAMLRIPQIGILGLAVVVNLVGGIILLVH